MIISNSMKWPITQFHTWIRITVLGRIVLCIGIYFRSNNKLTIDFNAIGVHHFAEFLLPLHLQTKEGKKKRRKSWRPEWDLNPVLKCKHTLSCSEQKREKAHMRKPQSCKLQVPTEWGTFWFYQLNGTNWAFRLFSCYRFSWNNRNRFNWPTVGTSLGKAGLSSTRS